MSGFEVISVVLGVYPIVIDGLRTCKAAKSGKGLGLLVNDLRNEEIRYTEFLGQLLGMDLAYDEKARLTDGTIRVSNLTSRQQTNLERRLGKAKAELICSTLEGMKEVLERMQQDIEKARASNSLDVGYFEKMSKTLRAVKLIRGQSSFRGRLVQLKQWNDRLRDHLGSQPLPNSAGTPRKLLPVISFPRHDRYVTDIYYAIHNGYQCLCNVAHSARLGLPELPWAMGHQGLQDDTSSSFKLLFPFEDHPESDGASVMSSQMSQNGSLQCAQLARGESSQGDASTIARIITREEDLDDRTSSRLSTISSTATLTTSTTSTSSRSNISKSRSLAIKEYPKADTDCIEDLCRMVRDLDDVTSQEAIGVLSSDNKRYELRRATLTRGSENFGETIDLDDLLTSYQDIMVQSYRFSLALRLSYAILQFYSTPWIDLKWSWKDFTTVINEDRPRNDDPLFITHRFFSLRQQVSKPKTQAAVSFAFWAGVGEERLTRLGFALIELGLGKRLSELRQDGSIPADSRMRATTDPDILDFWTAEEVLNYGLLFEEQGEDYTEVVRVLIKHQFMKNYETKLLSSRDPSFYKDVEQLVITPLYCRWTNLWGKRTSQLSL